MKNKAIWFKATIFLGATALVFSFQNCSNVRFSQDSRNRTVFLLLTDEDVRQDPNVPINGYQSFKTTGKKIAIPAYIRYEIPVMSQVALEGGQIGEKLQWISSSELTSCDPALVSATIASLSPTTFRAIPESSNCKAFPVAAYTS